MLEVLLRVSLTWLRSLSPSVVNITTSTTIAGVTDQARPQIPEGSPFEDLFKDFFNNGEGGQARPRRSSALGSFIMLKRFIGSQK